MSVKIRNEKLDSTYLKREWINKQSIWGNSEEQREEKIGSWTMLNAGCHISTCKLSLEYM